MNKPILIALAFAAILSGCQERTEAPRDSLDAIASDYVLLSLTIGEKEPGYIDAYYGPPELQARAKADAPKASLEALAARTEALRDRVREFDKDGAGMDGRRARFLAAQLTAAATRLRMLRGEKLPFADEAEGLFGVRPQLKPLSSFDPLLARIESLVPGPGPLQERVEAFADRFTIPKDRLKSLFDAAIAECRTRTLQHIK